MRRHTVGISVHDVTGLHVSVLMLKISVVPPYQAKQKLTRRDEMGKCQPSTVLYAQTGLRRGLIRVGGPWVCMVFNIINYINDRLGLDDIAEEIGLFSRYRSLIIDIDFVLMLAPKG